MEWPAAEPPEHLLVCCHHAGGGAVQFRSWARRFAPRTAVLALQLPGRQNRWGEPFLGTVDEIVSHAAVALLPRLTVPYTVFGHSMGGIIGYELSRLVGAEHGRWPQRLIVSATRPPHFPQGVPDLRGVDDRAMLRHFVDGGSLPAWVLDDPDTAEVMLPPLRADVSVCGTYRHRAGPPLPCPLLACGGTDDPEVSAEELAGWARYGAAGFEVAMFPGRHLFHLEPAAGLLDSLAAQLPRGRRQEAR